jgi:hypothetical protein
MRNLAALATLGLVATFGSSTAALADAISVPEPNTTSLFAMAAMGVILLARTFKRASQRG